MLQAKPTASKLPTESNQNPTSKVNAKARSATKKSILGVSNISVSIRSSKKTTDSTHKKPASPVLADSESNRSEKGVQVDELEITAAVNEIGDGPNIVLPSAKVLREIERNKQLVKQEQLKARLSETRKFEGHSARQGVHLTNLKEFMEKGSITRKREPIAENREQLASALKPASERTKSALEAYDRIKQKEEELIKMFSSI